ncbi:hypothetical protein BGX27_008319 [Mortierella sp. AM989]|nr:hypothetical protein BGX27_008319 [Mortierella sp. AM989]
MLLAWLYYAVYGHPRPGGLNGDVGHGGGHHDDDHRQCNRDHFIDWNGPEQFETGAKNIDFKFGKGNMATNVAVLTFDEIDYPIIVLQAKVTPTSPHDDDSGDDDSDKELKSEEMAVLDANTKEHHHHGLHVHVLEKDDNFAITIWADEYVSHGHHHHGHRKFCADIEASIILPKTFTKFGRLSIVGTLMNVDLRDLSEIAFEKLNITTTVGNVIFNDEHSDIAGISNVLARDIPVRVTDGAVKLPSVTVPEGSPVKVYIATTAGSIDLNTVLPQIPAGTEDQKHEISLTTVMGDINVGVQSAKVGESRESTSFVPGEIHLSTSSDFGKTVTSVDLADHQILYLHSKGVTGHIGSTVSDKFLGKIRLLTEIGSVNVIEAENSASEIEYEKHTDQIKSGRKQLKKNDGDKEEKGDEEEGEIILRSSYGRSELTFE